MLVDRPVGERGQLLIVTSLVIAIVLVGLALVLNSAIYTENLASRESTDSTEVTSTLGDAEDELEATMRYVNLHNNSSSDEVNRAFDAAISDLGNETTDENAKVGASYEFEVTDRTNGTHLRHTNDTKSFVSGGTNASKGDWWLAKSVPKLRSYTMTVEGQYLYTGTTDDFGLLIDEAFNIQLHGTDSAGNSVTWEIYIYEDSNTDNVTVFGGRESEITDASSLSDLTYDSCSADVASDTEQVMLSPTNNTFNGRDCESLAFEEVLDSSVDIRYENADDLSGASRSGGTYELAIGTTDYEDQHFYDASGAQSPFATHIIYDARVESRYKRADITHSRTIRVHPGAEGYVA